MRGNERRGIRRSSGSRGNKGRVCRGSKGKLGRGSGGSE